MKSRFKLNVPVSVSGLLLMVSLAAFAVAPRVETSLNDGWRFIRKDVAGAGAVAFDDSKWEAVNLPHTWNNRDGQDGGGNYYRGPGWYRRSITVEAGLLDQRRVYLYFDGASAVAEVMVNGQAVGSHRGMFSGFCFDVTPCLKAGAGNVLAVRVSNAKDLKVPPVSADFTFFGGLYRGVRLVSAGSLGVTLLDAASPGVYLKQVSVTPEQADLEITTKVRNVGAAAKTATVRCRLTDRDGALVGELSTKQEIPTGATVDVVQKALVKQPHLWNGRQDPYCYKATVEILDGADVVDCVTQPLGLRFFKVDPAQGFFLNGKAYSLHGVNRHQDRLDKGWAIGQAEHEEDYRLIEEMGCTSLRLAHYQHAQPFYDLCDRGGMVVIAEACLVTLIDDSPVFVDTVRRQVEELVKQNFNHPSICFWSLFNELLDLDKNGKLLGNKGPTDTSLVQEINRLAHQLDPTRLTTAATCVDPRGAVNFITDTIGFNQYHGWYGGAPGVWASQLDKLHKAYPTRPIAISEYGAGASINHHQVPPVHPKPVGPLHPEEWQCVVHEMAWKAMEQRPWLWGKYVWNMFDFAADSRSEGDHPGRNDKGMVTYDRKVRKDVYFWYQANWTTAPMVHITSKRFNPRPSGTTEVKVYSNGSKVELFLGGKSLGAKTSEDHRFIWDGVTLPSGTNEVTAKAWSGETMVTDTAQWVCNP